MFNRPDSGSAPIGTSVSFLKFVPGPARWDINVGESTYVTYVQWVSYTGTTGVLAPRQ